MSTPPAPVAQKRPSGSFRKSSSSKGSSSSVKVKGSTPSSSSKGGSKKSSSNSNRARSESYTSYIYRVLRQVHPQTRISKKAMMTMNSFIADTFERVSQEASRLCAYTKKDTLTAREVYSAVKLVLPGELAKHAISEGTKAVSKFQQSPGQSK
eukprot:GHVO01026727.1.p1 GENE.GHVO01026727.1~~GHVO01026727.1.p1  ORF type:complete len:153 (+),score=17.17 GHVO01026727.1:44-502(+)